MGYGENSSKVPRKSFGMVIFIILYDFVVDCGAKVCDRQKCYDFVEFYEAQSLKRKHLQNFLAHFRLKASLAEEIE